MNRIRSPALTTCGNCAACTPAIDTKAERHTRGFRGVPYDVSADGQRFLINTALQQTKAPPITLVVNGRRG